MAGVAIKAACDASAKKRAQEERAERERRDREERRDRLYAKYGRTTVAEDIIGRKIWVGESCDQLIDSLGPPDDTDEKVLKTKRKEILKYFHRGGNRYGLRVTLEDNAVVGWDEKL